MNPIEKHRSEIEKKISQLEQRFSKDARNTDYRFEARDPVRRHREYMADENKVQAPTAALSKTMEVKGRHRGLPGQVGKLKKNYGDEGQSYMHEILGELKDPYQNTPTDQGKEQKIKELQHMVKSLLEGQRVLEKQLNELKAKNIKEEINKSKVAEQSTPIQPNEPPLTLRAEQNKELQKKRGSIFANNSLVVNEPRKDRRPRKSSIMNKRKDFEQLYQQLKERNRGQRRLVVQQQWKSRLWSEVQSRVRQSDKQYKDTMHHNNKHEFDHLMSTYELQRKLKGDLISKVYEQCNDQIYK